MDLFKRLEQEAQGKSEIRNPKSEGNPKSEVRSPKSDSPSSDSGAARVQSPKVEVGTEAAKVESKPEAQTPHSALRTPHPDAVEPAKVEVK
jgi:hypothetical protein